MSGTQLIDAARRALVDDRRQLTLDELAALATLPDEDVPALADAAHAVRVAWCGDTVEVEGILSAKTGGCPEDCHFCSQSSKFDSPVKAVPLLTHDEVLRAARETAELGASEFCLVYAVRGPDERLMSHLEEIVPLVGRETGMNVAVSAGILDEDQAGAPPHRRYPPLQPQPRDGPVALRRDRHDPQLGGPLRHVPARPSARHGAVLRRAAGHG